MVAVLGGLADGGGQRIGVLAVDASLGQLARDGEGVRLSRGGVCELEAVAWTRKEPADKAEG